MYQLFYLTIGTSGHFDIGQCANKIFNTKEEALTWINRDVQLLVPGRDDLYYVKRPEGTEEWYNQSLDLYQICPMYMHT